MKILVTGTLGFIFSNFVRYSLKNYPHYLVGIDKAVYPYNLHNMYEHKDYKFYLADIADAHTIDRIFTIEKPDIVIGGAAESFVDNSITDIMPFLHTNVIGTQVLVNACLKHHVQQYIHISTDEVYGQKLSQDEAGWIESEPLLARNPYACSKAAAELVVRAAHETHGLQFKMTRSCNVYGPRQKQANLIPHIIHGLLENDWINIHGDGRNFRQYIYVDDKIRAIMHIIEKGKINTVYNIGDNNYLTNNQMVDQLAYQIGTDPVIKYVTDRKAHDFGYSVNSNKVRELGWKPTTSLQAGLDKTIQFYQENK